MPKAIIIHSDVWSGHRRWRDTSEITDHLSEMDAELLKARNMEILQKFYFIDYDISRDFYEQFHERRKQKTAQKRGLLRRAKTKWLRAFIAFGAIFLCFIFAFFVF